MIQAPDLMLAQAATSAPEMVIANAQASGSWVAELKVDGIRAVATIDGDNVTLHNRRHIDISHRYPDVVGALGGLGINAVLDGEIAVMRDGRVDFGAAHRRDAQSNARSAAALARTLPATFIAFDVLWLNGIDMRDLSYERRRARLDSLAATHAGLRVNPSSEDGEAMWKYVLEHQLEGLVLKRKDSRYRGRRDPAWVKVKALKRLSAVVSGYEPGLGHRAATFGALRLALLDGDQFVDIGSVGTGFTNADCLLISRRIKSGDHPIIVDVECMEVTAGGHLRQPSFRGIRQDLEITDCTIHQVSADEVPSE